MRRGTSDPRGSVARLAKTGRDLQARGEYFCFAVALGRRRPGGFKIAEKERHAYPSPDLEGLAHGEAGPRNNRLTIYKETKRERSNG